ncbi:MAG: ATP-binding protein [Rhodobacteraceae bacterium]|nr:ATP-binding protein [Paracoccaceae bacterium]
MSRSIIPANTDLGQSLRKAVGAHRAILVAGLPSSGKSLLVQQLAILAEEAGRDVHTLQWDKARQAFETPDALDRFPEIDKITHPAIRKAVGLWVRGAVLRWSRAEHRGDAVLIVELPVVAGRFVELLQPGQDPAERFLGSPEALFLVPVPSVELRARIEAIRAATIANPRHAQEARDAPPHIVEADWLAARRIFNHWNGIADDDARDRRYDPEVYRAVFERLGRFRQMRIVSVETTFTTGASAYERAAPVVDLVATPQEVAEAYARLEDLFPGNAADWATDGWSEY